MAIKQEERKDSLDVELAHADDPPDMPTALDGESVYQALESLHGRTSRLEQKAASIFDPSPATEAAAAPKTLADEICDFLSGGDDE